MQQIPEPVLLSQHDPSRVVYPQAVREAEVFAVGWFGEGGEGRGGDGRAVGGAREGREVLRGAQVGDDFASERVEGEDALRLRECVSAARSQGRQRGQGTHRERRIVMPRRMMQRPPQDRRTIPRLPFLSPEHLGRMLDRQPRFSLPGLLARGREVRVGNGRVFGIGTGEEACGDEILCECERSQLVSQKACIARNAPSVYFRRSQ